MANQISARLATVLRDLALSSDVPATILILQNEEVASQESDSNEAQTTAVSRQELARQQLARVGLGSNQIEIVNTAETHLVDAIA